MRGFCRGWLNFLSIFKKFLKSNLIFVEVGQEGSREGRGEKCVPLLVKRFADDLDGGGDGDGDGVDADIE